MNLRMMNNFPIIFSKNKMNYRFNSINNNLLKKKIFEIQKEWILKKN